MKHIILTCSLLFVILTLQAQTEIREIKQGNKYYEKEKYVEAEVDYRKALDHNPKSLDRKSTRLNSSHIQK